MSEEVAKVVLEKLKQKKPYLNYPDNFLITKIILNDDVTEWEEGFTS